MKQHFYLSLITIFFVACGNSPSPVETTSSDQLTETISTEEPILNDQPMNKENQEGSVEDIIKEFPDGICLLYTSPSPRDPKSSRMPSSA